MRNSRGFTLIELLTSVVIIGIMTMLAIPTYQNYVYKSRRQSAEAVMYSLSNAMEQHYTESNTYCDAGGTGGASVCGSGTADTGTPSIYAIPYDTVTNYTVTISAVSTGSYSLMAVPTTLQSGDTCGTLTLTSTGIKSNSSGLNQLLCW